MTTWCDKMPSLEIVPPEPKASKKIFVASFNRASDGAVSKIRDALKKENMLVSSIKNNGLAGVDYILACGDRKETFEFCLEWYGKIPIIHLWAGEVSQGTHDEIYRWAITQMSVMALCTNDQAADRVVDFYDALGHNGSTRVVGNVMLDNMPKMGYEVVLYNPPTLLSVYAINREIASIESMLPETYFWMPPNGDEHSDLVDPHVNARGLSRNQFLNLLKNCNRFISNSSCIDYEAKHIISDDRILRIGERNKERESITADMTIPNATKNIIEILKR